MPGERTARDRSGPSEANLYVHHSKRDLITISRLHSSALRICEFSPRESSELTGPQSSSISNTLTFLLLLQHTLSNTQTNSKQSPHPFNNNQHLPALNTTSLLYLSIMASFNLSARQIELLVGYVKESTGDVSLNPHPCLPLLLTFSIGGLGQSRQKRKLQLRQICS